MEVAQLRTVDTVDLIYTVDTVYTVHTALHCLNIREDINEKKHCPNHLNPPSPPDPNSGNLVLFSDVKKQLNKQLKVQYIGIFE